MVNTPNCKSVGLVVENRGEKEGLQIIVEIIHLNGHHMTFYKCVAIYCQPNTPSCQWNYVVNAFVCNKYIVCVGVSGAIVCLCQDGKSIFE